MERLLQYSFNICLVIPLCENTVLGGTRVLGELAGAWLAYIGAVKVHATAFRSLAWELKKRENSMGGAKE